MSWRLFRRSRRRKASRRQAKNNPVQLNVEQLETRVVPAWLDTFVPYFDTAAFPLHSGAAVGPLTSFDSSGQVGTGHETGSGNLDAQTTYAYTFDFTRSVDANGTWSYQEAYTYTLDSTTAPPNPPGATAHESGTFTYVFAGTSTAGANQFTLVAHLYIFQMGSQTEESTADGVTTVVTTDWDLDQEYHRTIVNSTNVGTGEALGTDNGNGSMTEDVTHSGTYSYPVIGGSVSGSVSGVDH